MVDLGDFPRGDPARRERGNIAPNATWLSPDIVTSNDHWRYESGKVFLGAVGDQLLGVRDNRHLMTIAGSRAGKGTSAIIPNLLLYPGSILCIDPKGENAAITAQRRRDMGHATYVLDPFGVSGAETTSFNPLELIDIKSERCVDDAALIADALIVAEAKGENSHFTSAARNWVRGLILHICATEPADRRNLLTLRERLAIGQVELDALLVAMMQSDKGYGAIKRAGNALHQKSEKELSSVLSTAIEQTDFLDSPAMARVLSQSDFALTDLKKTPTSIYLSLPAGRMVTHYRWLRIFINLALEAFERDPEPPQQPVLLIMDEFPILGHMDSIEKASGLIAGYGVRLWPIIQDISQLQRHYPKSWETFMGNAGLLQAFGNSDLTTLKYLSERLGQTTVASISKSEISTTKAASGFSGESMGMQLTSLMTSEEIGRFFSRQSNRQLLLWAGANPIAADRVEYYQHPTFEGLYQTRGY